MAAIDYSKIPTEDLEALVDDRYQDVSTPTLQMIAGGEDQKSLSFMDAVKESLSKRKDNIAKEFTPQAAQTITNPVDLAGRLLRTTGQVAGGINDVIGQGLMSGYRNLVPRSVQDAVSGAVMPAAKGLMSAAEPAINMYQDFKQAAPQTAGNIEAVLNIASLLPGGWLGTKAAKGVDAAVDAYKVATTTAPRIEKMIDAEIVKGFKKGIRPTQMGKTDANLTRKYYDNAKTAIRDIVETSPVKLSESKNILDDLSIAVANTKNKLWDNYTAISREAGQRGVEIDLAPIMVDLNLIAKDSNAIRTGLAQKAQSNIDRWKATPTKQTPQEAEELLASLNKQSKAFFEGKDIESSALATRMANKVREQLYSAVDTAGDLGYVDFRKRYGAQMAIEEDVAKRAMQYSRLAEYGFFDIANVPTAMEFVKGVGKLATTNVSGGLGDIGSALAGTAMKIQMKKANDAAEIIRKMFRNVENLQELKRSLNKRTIP